MCYSVPADKRSVSDLSSGKFHEALAEINQ